MFNNQSPIKSNRPFSAQTKTETGDFGRCSVFDTQNDIFPPQKFIQNRKFIEQQTMVVNKAGH